MRVLDSDLWVCVDCVQAIANDDYSGLDYHYNAVEAEQRMRAIVRGLARGSWVIGTDHQEFATSACDCCECPLAGERYEASILG